MADFDEAVGINDEFFDVAEKNASRVISLSSPRMSIEDFAAYFSTLVDNFNAKIRSIENARRQKQSAKALKRNARKAARKGKWPLDKKEALLARFAERSRGKSTDTAKELNSIGRAKELAYVPRLRAPYGSSKRYGTKPPRGRALDIPYLGHISVKQNPALKDWAEVSQ